MPSETIKYKFVVISCNLHLTGGHYISVLGFTPWKVIPYSDGITMLFPILIIFFYSAYKKSIFKARYIFWIMMCVTGILGGMLKATVYIPLIACILVESIVFAFKTREKSGVISFAICALLFGICLLFKKPIKAEMYESVGFVPNHDIEMSMTNYFYNGLGEESTGGYSPDGISFVYKYVGQPRPVREKAEVEAAIERIRERGLVGTLNFLLRKMTMTFNDGTFCWYLEGGFHFKDFPNMPAYKYDSLLRSLFWFEGERYNLFVTFSQFLWILTMIGFLLFGISSFMSGATEMRKEKGDRNMSIYSVVCISLIGIFLFIALFEGRARYLLNYLPIFILAASLGMGNLYKKIKNTTEIHGSLFYCKD